MLTQERVKHLFNYDANTGKLYWRNPTSIRCKVGQEITYINAGYLKVKVDGTLHLVHKIIYLYVTGHWPDYPNELVDHLDRDKLNNRFENFRLTNHHGNQHNRPLNRNSTTGYKGVTINKNGKYQAQAQLNGKKYYLGSYDYPEDASDAYQKFVTENHSL